MKSFHAVQVDAMALLELDEDEGRRKEQVRRYKNLWSRKFDWKLNMFFLSS